MRLYCMTPKVAVGIHCQVVCHVLNEQLGLRTFWYHGQRRTVLAHHWRLSSTAVTVLSLHMGHLSFPLALCQAY